MTTTSKPGEMILLIGGARAGKSAFAAKLAAEVESTAPCHVAFIATAEALDDEMALRIKNHRAQRPPHWLTIEEPLDLAAALTQASSADVAIVDCFTLFVSNWLLSQANLDEAEANMDQAVESFLAAASGSARTIICVSNEVGLGLVPDTPLGRVYRDCLGKVNQSLARAADKVYWLAAGIPVQIKPR